MKLKSFPDYYRDPGSTLTLISSVFFYIKMDQKEIFNLISMLTGQNNILTIPRIFIDFTGEIESALFLSQLLYWSGKTTDGWVYKTYSDWYSEISIKEKKLRGIKEELEIQELIETKVCRVKGITIVHYRVKQDILWEKLQMFISENLPEQPKREFRNGQVEGSGTVKKGVPTITETTNRDYKQIPRNKADLFITEIIQYLNLKTGHNYATGENERQPVKAYAKEIKARYREGHTAEEFKTIINKKADDWLNNEKMYQYLNPETLFRKSNFEKYLEQAQQGIRNEEAATDRVSRILDAVFQEGQI